MGPELLGATMLAALVLYALLGGADYGGGLWDLLARGPRAAAQRAAIDRALAPVWEANHVWLILVVVLLFTAFPPAFAALAIGLHGPLSLALLGIVLRGAAFVFRHYGRDPAGGRRWGRVFAIASTATPIALGLIVGALASGAAPEPSAATAPFATVTPFRLVVGLLALALFGFLAAVYLTVEADEPALADDFRRRALGALAAVVVLGGLALGLGRGEAPRLVARLVAMPPLVAGAAVAAVTAAVSLGARHFRVARAAAIALVAAVVAGWGLAQQPVLIGHHTLRSAAAPAATLDLLVPVLVAGAAILFPSLYLMLRVFKR